MSLDPNSPTLTRHLMNTLMNSTDHDGSELVSLLVTIQSIVKNISAAVRRAGIFNVIGAQNGGGYINIQVRKRYNISLMLGCDHYYSQVIARKCYIFCSICYRARSSRN